MNYHLSTRRIFLANSVAAGAGATVLSAYLTGARADEKPKRPPSQRLNLACIGVGGRAPRVIDSLCKDGFAEPVAFVDVDFEARPNTAGVLATWPKAKRFNDFRIMLDKMHRDIDAVVVVTPDHTHFTAAIAAMALRKPVYVEKPLTRTFEESEILMRAEKKFGVVTQMGNQGHTGEGFDTFCAMVDQGLCDNVTRMEAWKTPSLWFMDKTKRPGLPLKESELPKSLSSWDLWCGPRKLLPFNTLYHPFNWRGFYEYGMGMLGDWGAHIIDYPHDKLQMGLPTKISALRMDDHNQIYFPLSSHLSMHFPARGENRPAIDMVWKDGADCRPEIPARFFTTGDNGQLLKPRAKGAGSLLYGEDDEFAILRGNHGDAPYLIGNSSQSEFEERLKKEPLPRGGKDHFTSFVSACMGEGKTNSPFSVGAKLTQVMALGTIAQYLNTELTFAPESKQFVGNDEANVLLSPPARKEWEEFYRLA
ncbi:hypothetical protein FHS27_006234 [Rhodopirellula rubra]|uniref:Inositol 2-dehydrogenase n=1 Tax=Aporhodopirellula rubra TaxID=980271 RepID=A0A7W5E5W7_9BACT|nr:Gfo/Idh/MocA family oxidoreductase [Aporhodopirellula rubra]MBB3210387.1 hypothetical protein [Aporhodopirellula rubra]